MLPIYSPLMPINEAFRIELWVSKQKEIKKTQSIKLYQHREGKFKVSECVIETTNSPKRQTTVRKLWEFMCLWLWKSSFKKTHTSTHRSHDNEWKRDDKRMCGFCAEIHFFLGWIVAQLFLLTPSGITDDNITTKICIHWQSCCGEKRWNFLLVWENTFLRHLHCDWCCSPTRIFQTIWTPSQL